MLKDKQQIKNWLDKHGVTNYTILEDGRVDVEGNVWLRQKKLTHIDVQFRNVSGAFSVSDNQLTSLKGCPGFVGGSFNCEQNLLTSLEFGPQTVGISFFCCENKLTNLNHSPAIIHGLFTCRFNLLTSLQGAPREVLESFNCNNNQLISLQGAPLKIGHNFYCNRNLLTSLEHAPLEINGFMTAIDNPIANLNNFQCQLGEVLIINSKNHDCENLLELYNKEGNLHITYSTLQSVRLKNKMTEDLDIKPKIIHKVKI